MLRFDTKALFRVTLAVAAAALLMRASWNGSPRDRVIATVIYCGLMLVFACIGYRRNAKKAMMAEDSEREKRPE
jgi:hypothetical protein